MFVKSGGICPCVSPLLDLPTYLPTRPRAEDFAQDFYASVRCRYGLLSYRVVQDDDSDDDMGDGGFGNGNGNGNRTKKVSVVCTYIRGIFMHPNRSGSECAFL